MRGRVTLRLARPDDAQQLWEWRNEESMRLASFQSAPVPFAAHQAWLSKVLTDPSVLLLVGANDAGQDVGYVRFSIEGQQADISVCVDHRQRGLGLGAALIDAGCVFLWNDRPEVEVVAIVKEQNAASRATFLAVGFRLGEVRDTGGQVVHDFRRRCDDQIRET